MILHVAGSGFAPRIAPFNHTCISLVYLVSFKAQFSENAQCFLMRNKTAFFRQSQFFLKFFIGKNTRDFLMLDGLVNNICITRYLRFRNFHTYLLYLSLYKNLSKNFICNLLNPSWRNEHNKHHISEDSSTKTISKSFVYHFTISQLLLCKSPPISTLFK